MKNIVLIGMPGCGKSTFGAALAEALGRSFVDADEYLEKREGRTIRSFFEEGEDSFRDAEERTIRELSDKEGLVIATGGGVVKREINITRLRRRGYVIFLDRPAENILSDVEAETRPLLDEGKEKIFALYKERILLYRKAAHRIVDNRGEKEEVLRRLLELTKEEIPKE